MFFKPWQTILSANNHSFIYLQRNKHEEVQMYSQSWLPFSWKLVAEKIRHKDDVIVDFSTFHFFNLFWHPTLTLTKHLIWSDWDIPYMLKHGLLSLKLQLYTNSRHVKLYLACTTVPLFQYFINTTGVTRGVGSDYPSGAY